MLRNIQTRLREILLEIDFQPGLERVRETSRPRCDPQMLSPGDGVSGVNGCDGGDGDDYNYVW